MTTEPTDRADAILTERATQYGLFIDNASVAQSLKNVLAAALADKDPLPADMAEALEMICSKMARIVSGSEKAWIMCLEDIEGYARLVRERLEGNPR